MDWADRFARFAVSLVERRLTVPKDVREALVEQLAVSLRAAWRQRYARFAPPPAPVADLAATPVSDKGVSAV